MYHYSIKNELLIYLLDELAGADSGECGLLKRKYHPVKSIVQAIIFHILFYCPNVIHDDHPDEYHQYGYFRIKYYNINYEVLVYMLIFKYDFLNRIHKMIQYILLFTTDDFLFHLSRFKYDSIDNESNRQFYIRYIDKS